MLTFYQLKLIVFHATFVQILCNCNSGTDSGKATNDSDPLFLTSMIESGRIREAQDAARVKNLVVSDYNETILSYSGFLTVRPEYNSNMFFWFVPAQVSVNIVSFM